MSFGYSIPTISAIKAIPQSVLNELVSTRGVPSLIVEQVNRWYTYNPTSTLVGDDNSVITPNSNVGRWLGHGVNSTLPPIEIKIKKDDVSLGNIDTINFIGSNINVTIPTNTTTANVSITGGGGGGSSGDSWEVIWANLTEWEQIYLGL